MATLYLEQKCRQGLTGRGSWLVISMGLIQSAVQKAGTERKRPGKPLLHWRGRYLDRQGDRRCESCTGFIHIEAAGLRSSPATAGSPWGRTVDGRGDQSRQGRRAGKEGRVFCGPTPRSLTPPCYQISRSLARPLTGRNWWCKAPRVEDGKQGA